MVNYRSIIAVFLALATALMLNVSSVQAAKVKKPLTYTGEQLEQIASYTADLQEMRDRLPELAVLLNQKDWTFARNLIHGPFGELRLQMARISRSLLPDVQPEAKRLSKEVFDDLVAIDTAAQIENYQVAIRKYSEVLKNFDAFLTLIPESARS